jgi:hypothetical protein
VTDPDELPPLPAIDAPSTLRRLARETYQDARDLVVLERRHARPLLSLWLIPQVAISSGGSRMIWSRVWESCPAFAARVRTHP